MTAWYRDPVKVTLVVVAVLHTAAVVVRTLVACGVLR